jgi:hypothetical protein
VNRRQFLAGAGALAASGLARSRGTLGQSTAPARDARVTLHPDKALGPIPADFNGLGYEISSVAEAGLLSGKNAKLVQLVRTLGPAGVIRIGGDTSDFARYVPDGALAEVPKATVVNRTAIQDVGGFLRATGWKLIWGLNLGRGTASDAAEEARAVADAAGDRLLAIEIGNEPDLFPGRCRPRNYGYADFLAEYRKYKAAVRDRVPGVPLAGPDVAVHTEWVERFAADEGADLKLLTHHHYSQGPPESPRTTIENLLAGPARLPDTLARLQKISAAARLPCRFCEMNSCFHGGKPGVSDTFASALWVLDVMLTMAWHDCAGVNIETGMNQLGVVSAYSPIHPDATGALVARPIYYGMLAFARGAIGTRLQTEINAGGLNVKAYATRDDAGRLRVIVINKEMHRDIDVRVEGAAPAAKATVQRLTAPTVESTRGVTFGGSAVTPGGTWEAADSEVVPVNQGRLDIPLRSASAAVIVI